MDILGHFPQSEWGNKYILVMVDQFSKWVEIHAIPDISAEQTAHCAIDKSSPVLMPPFKSIQTKGKTLMATL